MKKCIFIVLTIFFFSASSVFAQEDIMSWLVGKWTDGSRIIQITSECEIRVYENDILIQEGEFYLNGPNGPADVELSKNLRPDEEVYFNVNDRFKDITWGEFGFNFTKIPDNYSATKDNSEETDFDGGVNTNVMTISAERCWKNISWAYGEWEIPVDHPSGKVYNVRLTPFYYQVIKDRKEGETLDFSAQPKKWFKLMEGENTIWGNVVYIDDLYFHFNDKSIYLCTGFDKRIYLTQTEAYVTSTVKIIFWVVFGVVCLAILFGLYVLVKKIIAFFKRIKETNAEKRKQKEEEQRRVAEDQKRIAEERKIKAAEEQRRVAEERKKAAELQRQKTERSRKEQSYANFVQPQTKTSVTPSSANSLNGGTIVKSAEPNLSRNSMNFCPSCGRKIEGAPKFCPECGRPLEGGVFAGSSMSKLAGGMANIYSTTSSTMQGVASNIKKNLNEKEVASRKTMSVLSVKYDDEAEEKTIGQCDVMIGSGMLKAQGSVAVTNKALLFYKDSGPLKIFHKKIQSLGNKIGISTHKMLYHKIPLKDIVRISRAKSVRDRMIYYSIETKLATHSLYFLNKPYLFSKHLSKVLNFDTCIYNIDLLPGENVEYITHAIVESANGTNYGTLYITNLRLAFARIVGSKIGVQRPSSRMTAEEGTEELFSIERFRLSNIVSEQKSWTACEYHINDDGADYIIKFSNRVPKAFLELVPNAEGDEDILQRKNNIKKGFKVAMLVASFVGLGSIADAAEDADVDDMDMDSEEMDLDDDGDIDAIGVDADGDGDIDAIGLDSDGDGQIDAIGVDSDGDGDIDAIGVDSDGDGDIDAIGVDADSDGDIDAIGVDSDGDGVIDMAGVDTNGNRVIDTAGIDTNGDGQIDAIGVDSDGDGQIDAIGVDADSDGDIDAIGLDTNGDGVIDMAGVDTNGNGMIDTAGIDTNGDGVIDTVTASNSASYGFAQAESGDGLMEKYYDSHNRVIEIDRQIMNTVDPLQREALIRERELLESQTPNLAEIIIKRTHGIN